MNNENKGSPPYVINISNGKSGDLRFKTKYHYTSPAAFLSILQNQNLRFTDARFMNDKVELTYFVKLLLDFIDKNKQKYPLCEECLYGVLSNYKLDDIKNLKVNNIEFELDVSQISSTPMLQKRIFVFCTSADSDALNMWNYYVNNSTYQGYNIGININTLLKQFKNIHNDPKRMIVYYGNVVYQPEEQYRAIDRFLMQREYFLQEHINMYPELKDNIRDRFLVLGKALMVQYIDSHGIFYKHPCFAHEKEFRIVVEIDKEKVPHNEQEAKQFFGDENGNIVEKYIIKNGLVVPFLQIPFDKTLVKEVTISPTTEFEIAKTGVEELFNALNYKGIKIKPSGIPIRF